LALHIDAPYIANDIVIARISNNPNEQRQGI
jgi:hypothetical protein